MALKDLAFSCLAKSNNYSVGGKSRRKVKGQRKHFAFFVCVFILNPFFLHAREVMSLPLICLLGLLLGPPPKKQYF